MGRQLLHGVIVFAVVLAGCGVRSAIEPTVDGEVEPPPTFREERCNGRDDDGDGDVDEPFRDADGHYLDDAHCGGCGSPCGQNDNRVLEAHCAMVDGAPTCAATRCVLGYLPSPTGRCERAHAYLCLPCTNDDDCGAVDGARCAMLDGELRCAEPCIEGACPTGYRCDEADALCVPSGGSCTCREGQDFDVACAVNGPDGAICAGESRCEDGTQSACEPPVESCNTRDDDCDGAIDEGFRDARGVYTLDPRHCGRCGVDCTATVLPQGSLVCGGDAFAPSCVLDCVDVRDGLQPGDRVDGDRDIATGCECTVRELLDRAGPVFANGEALDVNCDGADGIVTESFYVATDGDDDGPGSPTRPLATFGEAMRRAGANAASGSPRVHVYVATGSYAERVRVPDGVSVHGGYRRDFLALDPNGFVTEVRAPSDGMFPGSPALVAENVGTKPTWISWIRFVGGDAVSEGEAAIGAYLVDPSGSLLVEGVEVRAGAPSAGGAARVARRVRRPRRRPASERRLGAPSKGPITSASRPRRTRCRAVSAARTSAAASTSRAGAVDRRVARASRRSPPTDSPVVVRAAPPRVVEDEAGRIRRPRSRARPARMRRCAAASPTSPCLPIS